MKLEIWKVPHKPLSDQLNYHACIPNRHDKIPEGAFLLTTVEGETLEECAALLEQVIKADSAIYVESMRVNLGRTEEPSRPREEVRENVVSFIRKLSEANPGGEPHGLMEPVYCKACQDFDPDRETPTPLTLEEWRRLTREQRDYSAAFQRDIADAVDPFVFLVVLRDRLVFSGGCTDAIIAMISGVVDEAIDLGTMAWR